MSRFLFFPLPHPFFSSLYRGGNRLNRIIFMKPFKVTEKRNIDSFLLLLNAALCRASFIMSPLNSSGEFRVNSRPQLTKRKRWPGCDLRTHIWQHATMKYTIHTLITSRFTLTCCTIISTSNWESLKSPDRQRTRGKGTTLATINNVSFQKCHWNHRPTWDCLWFWYISHNLTRTVVGCSFFDETFCRIP